MSATAAPVLSVPEFPASCLQAISSKYIAQQLTAKVVCKVQVGSTEVDLSDVFANNHEEVSAPLFTRVC